MKRRRVLRGVILVMIIVAAALLWYDDFRKKPAVIAGLNQRPDIVLAIEMVKEGGVWRDMGISYLTHSEHQLTYAWLREQLGYDCFHREFGPLLAAQILADKGTDEAFEILWDEYTHSGGDGPNPCERFAAYGLGMLGEDIFPRVLSIALDEDADVSDRRGAMFWIAEMSVDDYEDSFDCKQEYGCELFGDEKDDLWVDEFVVLLESHPNSGIRIGAAYALVSVNEPRVWALMEKWVEISTDEWEVLAYESRLEAHQSEE